MSALPLTRQGSVVLDFVVLGTPQGARRHRTALRGNRAVAYHDAAHAASEQAIAQLAHIRWGCQPLDEPLTLRIVTHHQRPQALSKARRWWGDGARPFVGKPDADNIAKLVMDALTKAGVWVDDTRVARLVVERWYLPVGVDGSQVGVERTEVEVGRPTVAG